MNFKKIMAGALPFLGAMVLATTVWAAKPTENTLNSKQECKTIQSGEILGSDESTIDVGFDDWGYNYQGHMFNGGYCDSYRDAPWCQEYKDVHLSMKWNDAWLSNKDCNDDLLLDRHYGHDSYKGSGAWLTNHQSGEYEITKWNISGNWLIDFNGGTENREFRNLNQDDEGNVTGEFWWLNGNNWEYGGTLLGNLNEDSLILNYDRRPDHQYWGVFEGTVEGNSIVDGKFVSMNNSEFTWTASGPDSETVELCSWNYFVKIVAVPEDASKYDGYWYTEDQKEIGKEIWKDFAIIQTIENDSCAGKNGAQYISPNRPGLGNW